MIERLDFSAALWAAVRSEITPKPGRVGGLRRDVYADHAVARQRTCMSMSEGSANVGGMWREICNECAHVHGHWMRILAFEQVEPKWKS